MKFTRKQIVFLISYPFIHLIVSMIFLLMRLSTGLMHDEVDWEPTIFQQIASAVGGFGITIFWAPLFLWKRLGLPVSHQTFGEYFSIFLCGALYAVIGVLVYKKIYRR